MPYITADRRTKLDTDIRKLAEDLKQMGAMDGDMNYAITRLLAITFDIAGSPRYSKINTIIGILECVKQEFYSRVAVPYERSKAIDSGDVHEFLEFDKKMKN